MGEHKEEVKLAIEENWWMWRGFRPYVRAEEKFIGSPECGEYCRHRRFNVIDEDDHTEWAVFPLCNPSIDVLGIPCRSRKQRGWYQVLAPAHSAAPVARHTQQQMRSAADLPLELVFKIAEIAVPDIKYEHKWSRHELASCALVCRRWAVVLRPLLFRNMTTRSHGEMTRLLHIYRTSSIKLASHDLDPLTLEVKLGNAPFAHLAARLFVHPYYLEQIRIIGPLPGRTGAGLRSIHGCLPRSLPPSAICSVRYLVFVNVHFQYFADLVRTVAEIPALSCLCGIQLTWERERARDGLPSSQARPRQVILRPEKVTLRDCTTGQHRLILVLTGGQSLYGELGELVRSIDEYVQPVSFFEVCHSEEDISESLSRRCAS